MGCLPAGEAKGSTHYFKQIDSTHQIHLWGFAMIVTNTLCCLCLKRHERNPTFAQAPILLDHLWRPHDLPMFSSPKSAAERRVARELLILCVSELYRYEGLVEEVENPSYRSRCLKRQRKGKKLEGFSLKNAWGDLRQSLQGVPLQHKDSA